jgi:DNA-binding CsgD family transcriptional regulator
MKQTNVALQFFEGIDKSHISDETSDLWNIGYLCGVSDLSSLYIGGVLVMDFKERCLPLVSNRDIFLCGSSYENAEQLGYEFFSQIVHKDDIHLLIQIHRAILNSQYIADEKLQSQIAYFYFTVKMRNCFLFHEKQHYLMICYRMRPIFIKGKIRYGICTLNISGMSNSGNLRVYFNDTEKYDEYSQLSCRWKTQDGLHLDKYEKMILRLAKQGLSDREIAKEIGLSYARLRHRNSELYQKLGVKNMEQAIVVASNHLRLFDRR